MKRNLLSTIVYLAMLFMLPATLLAEKTRQAYPELLYARNLAPGNRLQIGFRNREHTRHKFFERNQSLYVNGEYAIYDSWSVYGSVPYSKRWLTDAAPRHRLDNVLLGSRLGFDQRRWMPVFGLEIELATGDEKDEGIGSKELGSLEPYLGIMYARKLVLAAAIRYNAQTNKQFMEKEKQHFNRTWLIDAAAGYRFSDVDLLLEYTYKYRSDPDSNQLSTHTIAPAVHYRFSPDIQLGLSIPYALSVEREFDIGGKLELTFYY